MADSFVPQRLTAAPATPSSEMTPRLPTINMLSLYGANQTTHNNNNNNNSNSSNLNALSNPQNFPAMPMPMATMGPFPSHPSPNLNGAAAGISAFPKQSDVAFDDQRSMDHGAHPRTASLMDLRPGNRHHQQQQQQVVHGYGSTGSSNAQHGMAKVKPQVQAIPMALPSPRKRKTPKTELDLLRAEHFQLTHYLAKLQQSQRTETRDASKWKLLALYERVRKQEAVQQHAKLKVALRDQQRMTEILYKHFVKMMCPLQSMGTMEENEWKVNVLSLHPMRRKRNADLILSRLQEDLPGKAINSGLIDAQDHSRFSKSANVDLLDQVVFQEVSLCERLPGHYLDLANFFWTEQVQTICVGPNVYFRNEKVESFDANTAYWVGRFVMDDARSLGCVGGSATTDASDWNMRPRSGEEETIGEAAVVSRSLVRRVADDGGVTFFWKNVRETDDEGVPDGVVISDNCSGWLSFQDGEVNGSGQYTTLFKCNLSAEFKPLGNRLDLMASVANAMQLDDPFPVPSEVDLSARSRLEKKIRRAFVDFITESLWSVADQHELRLRKAYQQPIWANGVNVMT